MMKGPSMNDGDDDDDIAIPGDGPDDDDDVDGYDDQTTQVSGGGWVGWVVVEVVGGDVVGVVVKCWRVAARRRKIK